MCYGSFLDSKEEFMGKLRAIYIRRDFKDFEALDNIERASFVLGCEIWTENFDSLVKEYMIDLWEVRRF